MIELIWVILILGILAVVVITKLATTRDDAKSTVELTSLATCINDAGSAFTASGVTVINTAACSALKCFVPSVVSAADGDLTIAAGGEDAALSYCIDAQARAAERGLVATHSFGGTNVSN